MEEEKQGLRRQEELAERDSLKQLRGTIERVQKWIRPP
jgi:hypothetical protein